MPRSAGGTLLFVEPDLAHTVAYPYLVTACHNPSSRRECGEFPQPRGLERRCLFGSLTALSRLSRSSGGPEARTDRLSRLGDSPGRRRLNAPHSPARSVRKESVQSIGLAFVLTTLPAGCPFVSRICGLVFGSACRNGVPAGGTWPLRLPDSAICSGYLAYSVVGSLTSEGRRISRRGTDGSV